MLTNRRSRGPCKTDAEMIEDFDLKTGSCIVPQSPVATGAMADDSVQY